MKPLVLMRGGGDIASGAVYRLRRAGYPVVISEIAIPTMIRREVCYGNAVHRGEMILERFVARHVSLSEHWHRKSSPLSLAHMRNYWTL